MRDDLLKEQLVGYARDAAEEASPPGAAAIHRRARRHYQRVAALTVTGVLAAAGIGIVLGVRGATPTVPEPQPPATGPSPAATSTTATTRPPATSTTKPPSTTRAAAAAGGELPATFVAEVERRVVVMSTATGKAVRTLWGPHRSGRHPYAVGASPDRRAVYFSADAADEANACQEPGIFRVPFEGGPATRMVADEVASGLITTSADGSRLAYLGSACPTSGRIDVVLRGADGALLHRWTGPNTKDLSNTLILRSASLSPDGRQVAVTVFDQLTPVGVRLLDASSGASFADGRLIKAPDPGCGIDNATFHPRTGQLAVFERCLSRNLQGSTPPRFRLVYLDPASGRPLSRPYAFDDRDGADLHVSSMDFDQSGRRLLYMVSSADPLDYLQPRPATGTWRWSGGRPAVRIDDDRQLQHVGTDRFIPAGLPAW
jgi:hypothetical protein